MMEIFATEARRLKLHGIPHSRKREKKKKNQSRSRCQVLPSQGRNGPGRGQGEQFPFLTCQENQTLIVRGRASGDLLNFPFHLLKKKYKVHENLFIAPTWNIFLPMGLAYHFPSPHFISHINWFFFLLFCWYTHFIS